MITKQTTLDLNGPILSFTQHPQSVTINTNGSTQFVGVATALFPTQSPANPAVATGSISYKWYERSFGALSDGSNSFLGLSVSGSSTSTLTITNATKTNLEFYVVADYTPSAYSQPSGSAVIVGTARSTPNAPNEPLSSNSAILSLNPLISVVQNPSSSTVSEGITATFSALGSASDGSSVQYRWQLNGSDIFDSSNISGSGTSNLTISSTTAGTSSVRAKISHPTASNSPIFTNSANFSVVATRRIIKIEDQYTDDTSIIFSEYDISQQSFTLNGGTERQGRNLYLYCPERSIDVQITLAAAAGLDRNGFKGGQGGVSIFNYTFEQNVEYVIKLATTVYPIGGFNGGAGVASLYRKSKLVASCGGGGGAGTAGNGGFGGGINLAGQPGEGRNAGAGGIYVAPGSFLSGSFRSGSTGGIISTCMNGQTIINATGISACNDFPGLTQMRNATNVIRTNTAFLFRGYKPGSPNGYRNNGGDGSGNDGGGGSGTYGGNAATGNFGGGGGGGSGYSDGSINLIASFIGGNPLTDAYITIQLR